MNSASSNLSCRQPPQPAPLPILPPPTTRLLTMLKTTKDISAPSPDSSIIYRLLSVFFIGLLSVWANLEASKGFELTVTNDATNSPAGKRFTQMYVSDDRATREVLRASSFIETLLYDNIRGNQTTMTKKLVKHVVVRLARRNLRRKVTVKAAGDHKFVMNLCPSLMEAKDVKYNMASAIHRGMARIWLYDGGSKPPLALLDGMVEYISILAGFGDTDYDGSVQGFQESAPNCWEDKTPKAVAHFLNYCERESGGFIRRLNEAMKEGWRDWTVDEALGMPAQHLCKSFRRGQAAV
ncbi:hypothetical protein ACJRO7_006994 [Eucalyptus globulus]|uniref:Uncharacterized protein n=1 Tax=Eucalyptus globulus TaxID=34317 RepID=A0ABD3IJP4_EUCGL